MSAWHRLLRIGRDERAQAMTEFVIVIPLVLFIFYAMLQTMLVAQAAQLTNYAAFAAARSYATSYSKFLAETGDHDQARDAAVARAKNAALLVMAPVSQAQPGEALQLWRPIRRQMQGRPRALRNVYGIAEGYITALIYRMKGFTVELNGAHDSSTAVVKVQFDYLVPVVIPGLAEMWNYLHGIAPGITMDEVFDLGAPLINPAGINEALRTVMNGLTLMESSVGDGSFGSISSAINNVVDGIYSTGFAGARHNVTLKAKSLCGFEPWSGRVRSNEITSYCEEDVDENVQRCRDSIDVSNQLVDVQVARCREAEEATDAYEQAQEEREEAERTYNNCPNPDGEYVEINGEWVKAECVSQWRALQDAKARERAAYAHMERKSQECEDAGTAVERQQQEIQRACQPSSLPAGLGF